MVDLRHTAALLALMSLDGVGPAKALKITRGELPAPGALDLEGARARVDACALDGVHVIGFYEERFPERLRRIPAPPAVLYVRGELEALHQPRALAVVGTRRPSRFGATAAQSLTTRAAEQRMVIVSGLARGCDRIAHEAALDAGAPTVAVLASGVDAPSPAEHRDLADRILAAGGALISEQPPGTVATAPLLVARNRLQSGLSAGVLVAQTAVDGGTPHTARFAAQQGRPVFCPAPPGEHPASAGLRVLLSAPARDLPGRMPAFAQAKRMCADLGDRPLAIPVTRADAHRMLALVDETARAL